MWLRRNSLISATSGIAASAGLDGNINVDTKFLVAVPSENSDIIATGFGRSPGSNIQVNAQGIFGTQFRERPTFESDIVATGNVILNIPDIDPNSGLINLPDVPVDTQVTQSCTAGGSVAKSEFIITGRGGLPPSPGAPLTTDTVQVDLVTLNPNNDNRQIPTVTSKPTTIAPAPIVEATGWMKNAFGEVVLTANPHTALPNGLGQNPLSCSENSAS